MILVLTGESASGKSTMAAKISEKIPSFSRVITYTTRPIRNGESQDVDYHFVSNDTFLDYISNDKFVEHAKYKDWFYGTALEPVKGKNQVVVLTPAGARAVKKKFPEQTVVIYLMVDRRSRLIRLLERGDNIDEAYRRNLSDLGQFDMFDLEADIVIKNDKYILTKDEVFTIVKKEIDKRLQLENI